MHFSDGLGAGAAKEKEEGPVVAEAPVGDSGYYQPGALTSTLLHLNTLILFTTNLKLHTTAFAFMRLCYCFYLVFTTAVELFVFAQILPRPSTFTQHRGAHQLRTRSGINRLLLARSLRRHQ